MVRDEIEEHKSKLYKVEFVKILKMSGPVIFAYMLQNSLQTGSVLVVGRLVMLRLARSNSMFTEKSWMPFMWRGEPVLQQMTRVGDLNAR